MEETVWFKICAQFKGRFKIQGDRWEFYIMVPVFGGVSCMLRLVRLLFTKPKVSFTVKSASYHACSFVLTQVLTPICLTKTRLASFLGFLTVVKLAINTVPGMLVSCSESQTTFHRAGKMWSGNETTRHVCWKRSQRTAELEDGKLQPWEHENTHFIL